MPNRYNETIFHFNLNDCEIWGTSTTSGTGQLTQEILDNAFRRAIEFHWDYDANNIRDYIPYYGSYTQTSFLINADKFFIKKLVDSRKPWIVCGKESATGFIFNYSTYNTYQKARPILKFLIHQLEESGGSLGYQFTGSNFEVIDWGTRLNAK